MNIVRATGSSFAAGRDLIVNISSGAQADYRNLLKALGAALEAREDAAAALLPAPTDDRSYEEMVAAFLMVLNAWPAAGFVDTEIRCLTELEHWNAEKEVQPRVQA
jgi:hypothetical protein